MAGSNNWKFRWPFGRKSTDQNQQITPEQIQWFKKLLAAADMEAYIAGDNIPMPISGDSRSSVPDVFNSFAPTSKLQEVPPDFSVQYHDTLRNLASYNADFSYAVDNIVQLGNTKHNITFSDKVKDSQAREMLDYLKLNESSWYGFSDGQRGLKADALSQVAIHGCLSIENIPNKNLKSIKQVVRVDPKNIRFVYDSENDMYIPCQQAPTISGQGRKMLNGLIQLNQRTYNYIGMRKYSSSPYPTPPLITAISGLIIQNKMAGNFSFIMDKLGMLGFLSAEVSKPDKFKGESDEAYFNRMVKYLDVYVYPQLAKNLSKGVVAGFKDTHEFKLQGNNMNVQGAQGLVEIVNLMVFAGLKQDPNMLGRNYSTTETFGRVILTKLVSQVEDYQAVVDSYFERLYLMALRLAGYNPGYVEVTSDKPLVSDQFKDQQAEEKRIANVKTKRDMGIISQSQAATELGYDKPFSKKPLGMGTGTGSDDPSKKDDPTGSDGSDPKENSDESQNMIEALTKYHNGQVKPYDYAAAMVCGHGRNITRNNFQDFTDFGDPKLNAYTKSYFNSVNDQFKKALDKITPKWKKKWETYDSSTPIDTIQREFYMILLQYWEPYFSSKVVDDIKLNINKIYTHFRKDKDVFSTDGKSFDTMVRGESFFDPPEPLLDMTDFRTIEFMEQFDEMYLGKFITDEDTQKRFYRFLQDEYAGGNMPIGKGGQDLNAWMKGFTNELELEAWKIRRIIDTSVSKVRNFANVNYMKQAEVDEYEIIEVEDKLTCDYCMHMAGHIFKVDQATQQLNKEINSGPRSIGGTSPFVTAYKVDQFKLLSKEELASRGFLVPPFHPHCRGRLVAHF